MSYKVLLADDDRNVLSALKLQLKISGFQSASASRPKEVLLALKESDFDLVLMDLNYQQDTTSGSEGLQLISDIRALDSSIPIVAMTGWGTIDIAVDAMRRGANDFIEKPCDNNRLNNILNNLLALRQSQLRTQRLESENALLRDESSTDGWVCKSKAMQSVMKIVENVAETDINILIRGENGTGKSQLAKLIHAQSARSKYSFIAVNMGAISEAIFESELFGHVKGSFTDAKSNRIGRFELADSGTLFMDEIANIPISQQQKLLRVLENGEFEKLGSSKSQHANVRLISATNAELDHLVELKQFRQDLYFRVNSIEIILPPLRDRQEDIEILARQFLEKHSIKYQREISDISSEAMESLRHYSWPGNVREMDHLIERAVLMSTDTQIQASDLLLKQEPSELLEPGGSNIDWTEFTLEQAEKKLIELVLRKHNGNAKEAATSLGYSRSAFYRRLEKFGL